MSIISCFVASLLAGRQASKHTATAVAEHDQEVTFMDLTSLLMSTKHDFKRMVVVLTLVSPSGRAQKLHSDISSLTVLTSSTETTKAPLWTLRVL